MEDISNVSQMFSRKDLIILSMLSGEQLAINMDFETFVNKLHVLDHTVI